jgi:antitoxin component of MazEF toxin-antitoxin module
MNASLKITKIGNSAGVVLPKELLAKLRAGVGDTLYVSKRLTGSGLQRLIPLSRQDGAGRADHARGQGYLRVLAK